MVVKTTATYAKNEAKKKRHTCSLSKERNPVVDCEMYALMERFFFSKNWPPTNIATNCVV